LPKVETHKGFNRRILTEDGFVKKDDIESLLTKRKAPILPVLEAQGSEPSVKPASYGVQLTSTHEMSAPVSIPLAGINCAEQVSIFPTLARRGTVSLCPAL